MLADISTNTAGNAEYDGVFYNPERQDSRRSFTSTMLSKTFL
jgi:hypothetical protein